MFNKSSQFPFAGSKLMVKAATLKAGNWLWLFSHKQSVNNEGETF